MIKKTGKCYKPLQMVISVRTATTVSGIGVDNDKHVRFA